jgi:hypothetical protein
MRGDIPCTYWAAGAHHPIPATAWQRGYRLSFPDSALIPTETVSGLPVLADVRVCEETLSRWLAGIHPSPTPVRQAKRAARPGRPTETGYAEQDSALVAKITKVRGARSFTEAAWEVIGRDGAGAPGTGTPESKIKRLSRARRDFKSE